MPGLFVVSDPNNKGDWSGINQGLAFIRPTHAKHHIIGCGTGKAYDKRSPDTVIVREDIYL